MVHHCCNEDSNQQPCKESPKPLREITVNFLQSTKLHGIRYMYLRQKSCKGRTFWILAFLASVCLLCTWSSNRIHYLMSFPFHTRIHMMWANVINFPAVTFCNNNMVRFHKLTKSDLYFAGHWLGLTLENKSVDTNVMEYLTEDKRKQLSRLANFSRFLPPKVPENMMNFYYRLGHQIEDMLVECKFQGDPCGPADFTPVYTRYGKCYTFNANKNSSRITKQSGMGNGLEIMLDIQQDEYLPIWKETNETSLEAGIKVQIHSQDEPPYIHQLGFGVSPGFQTFVSCQEQRLTYLPQPWGKCRPTTERMIPGYDTYSISACRLKCEKEEVLSRCQCRMVHMPGNETICSPNFYIECADDALAAFQKNSTDPCTCETPCNLTRYGKELSMVKIPSRGSVHYLSKKYNKSEEHIRENFLVLDVFFEALNYETIEQKRAYDVAGLLGDIGGQMGLFIGASLLTILEILDYIYEVIKDKIHRLLKPQKEQNKRQSSSVATLRLEDMKPQESCEMMRSHPEGAYSTNILPNHPIHHSHHGVFEDFAC
ncbi:acid-sensing ion channel 4-A-like [Erpetoichthys calabaricus]|uniref:acid-sensing ion channel 4-A-like n=1 Tax=Erpetoichthys calabaricus TaxID=27687 RepID=UPI002234CB6C|nr:acid-sensing ion channel 4-A-like [Erpetoichthys calabaricus]XP_051786970.1 acid-sensing ion channel 4-A-like [Erpetoichthys calabaricus]